MDAVVMKPMGSSCRRLDTLVDEIFKLIATMVKISSRPRQKEALKTILLNLIHGQNLNKPVRYSRDKNNYRRDRRYGLFHYKYNRLIPIIDALEGLGFIEQSSYYNDPDDKGGGLQTRMWGTDLLWEQLIEHRLTQVYAPVPEPQNGPELLILRNEDKQHIKYRETRQTRQMREDLERYNAFIDEHCVSGKLTGDFIVDNRWLVENLYQNIKNGKAWIQFVRLNNNHSKYKYIPPIPTSTKHLIPFGRNPYTVIQYTRDRIQGESNPIPITHTKRWKVLLVVLLRRFWSEAHFFEKDLHKRSIEIGQIPYYERQKVLDLVYRLRDLGVDELVFVLDHEHLRRVFNRKSWECGGRAYGALHQSMLRKPMREKILINGQPTVELDYSAFHILMLYHLEGIDYQDDPYEVCEGPEMRDIYKIVGLVAINAENKRSAYGAIRKELRDRGIPLPAGENPLVRLVRRFKDAHPRIAKYICADMGIRLMNMDSRIMNAILLSLMDRGILGLSVYDSVIVQQRHRDTLYETMIREYRDAMGGFEPRLKLS